MATEHPLQMKILMGQAITTAGFPIDMYVRSPEDTITLSFYLHHTEERPMGLAARIRTAIAHFLGICCG